MCQLDHVDRSIDIPVKLVPGVRYEFSGKELLRYDAADTKHAHHNHINKILATVALKPAVIPDMTQMTGLDRMVGGLQQRFASWKTLPADTKALEQNEVTGDLTPKDQITGLKFAKDVIAEIRRSSYIGDAFSKDCIYNLQKARITADNDSMFSADYVLETQVQKGLYVYYFEIEITLGFLIVNEASIPI